MGSTCNDRNMGIKVELVIYCNPQVFGGDQIGQLAIAQSLLINSGTNLIKLDVLSKIAKHFIVKHRLILQQDTDIFFGQCKLFAVVLQLCLTCLLHRNAFLKR